jgi:hypothetical protein
MKKLYQCLYPEEFSEVSINWTKPTLFENFINLDHDKQWNAYLYKILVKYPTGSFKMVYLGKTYYQFASGRLSNPDHQNKYESIKKKYPHHKIYVSMGDITTSKKKNAGLIDSVEKLLIYSHSNDDFELINSKNKNHHGLTYGLRIINMGYKTNMYSEIAMGVHYK